MLCTLMSYSGTHWCRLEYVSALVIQFYGYMMTKYQSILLLDGSSTTDEKALPMSLCVCIRVTHSFNHSSHWSHCAPCISRHAHAMVRGRAEVPKMPRCTMSFDRKTVLYNNDEVEHEKSKSISQWTQSEARHTQGPCLFQMSGKYNAYMLSAA